MLPQPIPARSNACLEPKSARRHVLTPITEKSRPSVSVERSVSTSCTKFRAAPGACARPAANGWLGAATGMSSTPPTLIRSMPGSVASTPLMPISAMPEWTSWVTAPSASTYSRSVTVGNVASNARIASTSRAVGSITSTARAISASSPSSNPLTLARRLSTTTETERASDSTAAPASVNAGLRAWSRSNSCTQSCCSRLAIA